MENENPSAPQSGEMPSATQEPIPLPDPVPPSEEPIILGKLFPEAKHDLDTLFPDPQMKQLLKEVHRTRQGNQRFLKRLNLSKIQADGEDPDSDS